MISSADFIRPLPFRRWVCWHQPSPVGKGAIARQRHAPATTCRADLMATGGQISCPPAGNFLSVSGQFPLSADIAASAARGSADQRLDIPPIGTSPSPARRPVTGTPPRRSARRETAGRALIICPVELVRGVLPVPGG